MQANSKEIAVVAIFMQGKGSVLNHEKEGTTVPSSKDLISFLFLLAESCMDLLSCKYCLHTVMNSANAVVLPPGLKGEDKRRINT